MKRVGQWKAQKRKSPRGDAVGSYGIEERRWPVKATGLLDVNRVVRNSPANPSETFHALAGPIQAKIRRVLHLETEEQNYGGARRTNRNLLLHRNTVNDTTESSPPHQ